MVLRVNAIVESTIKSIDITAITWKSDESTDQTELINRELPGLRVKYFPLLIFFSLSVFIDSIGVLIIYTHSINKSCEALLQWRISGSKRVEKSLIVSSSDQQFRDIIRNY